MITLTATILTRDYEVVDVIDTIADDFAVAERIARRHRGCIQWSRASDGQCAYWSPAGATFAPHWYR